MTDYPDHVSPLRVSSRIDWMPNGDVVVWDEARGTRVYPYGTEANERARALLGPMAPIAEDQPGHSKGTTQRIAAIDYDTRTVTFEPATAPQADGDDGSPLTGE